MVAIHTIGGRIVALRNERRISQLKLAAELGIAASALLNLEKNVAELRVSTLVKLSDYFKVSIDYIILGVDSDEGSLDIYRSTGLDDSALAALASELGRGNISGGLKDFTATLNALVSGGVLDMIWLLIKLRSELQSIDKNMNDMKTPKPINLMEEMRLENALAELYEKRELMELRFMRRVEHVFKTLIPDG
ncbi:hypothetical protein FACS1894184_17680 [Clostridia bacterium]|nr:hypothetical protein FACS1894184_17680 [Clostridia bacterium]